MPVRHLAHAVSSIVLRLVVTATAFGVVVAHAGAANPLVGNLAAFSGPTAAVSTPYSQAKIDAAKWINAHGGINGKPIDLQTVDYGYEVPRAVRAYQEWLKQGLVAVQGWGTPDTQALVGFVAEDRIPYFSASFSAKLTDPLGKGPETQKPSPYNFIMGPSYSDSVRALLQWAKADWDGKHAQGRPKYVHMGDNHPYPNAAKKAGEEYARELGFDVLPAIQYSLAPGDFRQQCLTLKQSGADYAYLANTSDSNVTLLKTCAEGGVGARFMANIWGFDETVMAAAGPAANGVVWVVAAQPWTADTPNIKLVQEIARNADPQVRYRTVHYVLGICAFYYMRDAMEWADRNGGITGPNIRNGMHQQHDWAPAGLEGVCPRATWTPEDHRGINSVLVYQAIVNGTPAPGADIAGLIADHTLELRQVYEADIPRRPEWLGW